MNSITKVGIIICDRYRRCAGGKCLRAMKKREGAFSIYQEVELELVGYTSCDGCPGGNVEYAAEEMVKNGANVIHLATGLVVGYPPCPYLESFVSFLETSYPVKVVVGTHPIPQKYLETHTHLGTFHSSQMKDWIESIVTDEYIRSLYA